HLVRAGIGGAHIAKAWIPHLQVQVQAGATAPHMRIVQITDTQLSYRTMHGSGNSHHGTGEAIAKVIEAHGRSGLVVCPKFLRVKWEGQRRLPGWTLWNF